jgi:hypothetical protein
MVGADSTGPAAAPLSGQTSNSSGEAGILSHDTGANWLLSDSHVSGGVLLGADSGLAKHVEHMMSLLPSDFHVV